MFQTHLHLWLQTTFDGSWMLPLMTAVSALGYAPAYILLIAVCAFGVRLRPGLTVMLAIVLMSGLTSVAKHAVDLPRPSDIDARVLDKGRSGRHLVGNGAPADAWSLPSAAAISRYRADPTRDPGLPSGHVGVATAAGVALLLGFGVRAWYWRLLLLAGWPALMAVSRMYLGRHFLADVLAGWLLGIGVAVLACMLMPRAGQAAGNRPRMATLALMAAAAVAGASQSPWLGMDAAGQLAGLVLILFYLQHNGWPEDPQRRWQRFAGPVLFVGLNLAAAPVIGTIAALIPLPDTRATAIGWYTVGTMAVLLATFSIRRAWTGRRR